MVGVNCHFDPFVTLRTMAEMKRGLVDAGLFARPSDAGHNKCAAQLGYEPEAQHMTLALLGHSSYHYPIFVYSTDYHSTIYDMSGLRGKVHLMSQPLGYMTPDAGKQGFIDLPEFPFGARISLPLPLPLNQTDCL